MGLLIRDAGKADAAACAEVYAPYVRDTVISFETTPPGAGEMAERIAAAHLWLVAEDAGTVLGYAYAGRFMARAAYRWACEVSVYLDREHRRAGLGKALYGVLLPRLAALGFTTAVAGMTLPNEASAGLHRAMGFEPVGTYRRIGWKFGAWHDVAWTQLSLVDEEHA
ncbi:GNAT family N-acetyltransferase [Sciscionella sediminilitoris]|uniref:GNAT family N-acetyltransferase n=1 Tax=Sciscionella sediminilitoris TaxID=1445613 RepID=UPI0004DFADCB|nr:GNAT family N-acetyltransferase [Sciscionella sp. SE31]